MFCLAFVFLAPPCSAKRWGGGETEARRQPPLPRGGRLEVGWGEEKLAGVGGTHRRYHLSATWTNTGTTGTGPSCAAGVGMNQPKSPYRCPGRLWSLLLWRYSRPTWTWSCAAYCRWPCLDRGLGQDDPQRSLPTPNILLFCERWIKPGLALSSLWLSVILCC